jgi:hypothetical protein
VCLSAITMGGQIGIFETISNKIDRNFGVDVHASFYQLEFVQWKLWLHGKRNTCVIYLLFQSIIRTVLFGLGISGVDYTLNFRKHR